MGFLDGYARKFGVVHYLGLWNAATNDPPIVSGQGQRNGYYVVSVSGKTNIDGESDWNPKDWILFNGLAWEKIDNSDEVGDGMLDGGTPSSEFDSLVVIEGGGV